MKLQRIDRDGLELVVNLEDGAVYASQSAVARMVEKDESTIRRFISSAQISVLSAEIQTGTGLKTSALLDENGIYQAFAKYKPDLLIQCAKAGLRLFLHELAGFHYSVSQPVLQISPKEGVETINMVVHASDSCVKIQETFAHYDARLAQICIDRIMQVVTSNQNLLPASNEPQLSGCVEIANKLGFSVGKELSNLGKFVAQAWRNSHNDNDPPKAKREVGGAMRDVAVYPSDDPVVTSAIKEYYAKRNNKL